MARRVAVFLPNWIGDVVMATPAVRALRDGLPGSRLVGVCRGYVAGVLAGSPWFDKLILADRSDVVGAARRLRRERIDAAVLMPNSFRSALVSYLAGCKRRVGFLRFGRGLLLTDRLKPEPGPSPIIDEYLRLVEPLGVAAASRRMGLFTTRGDEDRADDLWHKFRLNAAGEVIGLNPGAAFGAAKFWPVESFAALARRLCDSRGARVVVLCGPGEREQARRIAVEAGRPGVCSLAGETLSLGLSKAVVKRLSLLITTDSGPRHFAAAFGRPVVTIFGPTHVEWTETYFQHAIHLQKKVPCGPCQLRECPTDHRCMRELRPAEVFDAAAHLLDRGVRHAG